eukprot:CAMPEP_0170226300 /NCGR_PEP_ID=MMETSP0116_2-20130129/12861_1 /TAXON_ID=400756 /ORGANISM="Durinskia baltica, Strain CSIRO CS-38" /LENGTH=236 /DNA_ID=CAMNT_0010477025 /DNA_START=1 /DNA_END=706 /DNA_ORIENTATION=+
MLKEDRVSAIKPTLYPQSEELLIHNIRFRTFDLGGHETARRIWKDYYASVNGVVFILDAADRTRFNEAREELHRLLDEPALAGVPVAVLGNKIDIPIAASEDELRSALNLPHHRTTGRDTVGVKGAIPAVEVFMCSVVRRMGYAEAFKWLSQAAMSLRAVVPPPASLGSSQRRPGRGWCVYSVRARGSDRPQREHACHGPAGPHVPDACARVPDGPSPAAAPGAPKEATGRSGGAL